MYRYRDTEHIGITPVTETGGVVTIDNADDVILIQDLVADIEPIQDLHGYEKTWSGGNGKNKAHEVAYESPTAQYMPVITADYEIEGGKRYIFSFDTQNTGEEVYRQAPSALGFDSFSTYKFTCDGTRKWFYGTATTDATFTNRSIIAKLYTTSVATGLCSNFMIEKVADDVTQPSAYEPYSNICPISGHTDVVVTVADDYDNPTVSDTYTTALGRTVYGGTLDVVSGELVVDRAMVDLGTLTYSRTSSNRGIYMFRAYPTGITTAVINEDLLTCDMYDAIPTINANIATEATFPNGSVCQSSGGASIRIRDDNHTDITEFKTSVSGHTLVYPLATPQTYQLTAQQISTLLGQNNVWASSGNIKVVYAVDLKKYVTLPKEAVSINGTYIEKILDGYSTLYVKGRESLGVELNTYSVGTANGEKVKGKRYPARVLTVGFQLLADNEAEFRQRFNQLNNLLSLDEADFVFNDETDKYFTGYPVMDASIEAGRNNVTGEWQIYCAYPFKRSVEVKTLSSTDASGVVISGSSATFTFDYNGTQPARPILRAEFASAKEGGDFNEDGDCGFVAFLNTDEDIIQLGNPDVIDVDVLNKNGTLANSEFSTLTDWTASGISVGSITDTYWARGVGQTMNFARGTGTLSRSTTGAVGFEFDIVHRLAVSAPAEVGTFEAHLKNGNKVVVGFEIVKTGNGTGGTVNYIINDKIVGTDSIDLSYYNTNFGYCNRTPVYVQQSYQQQVITYVKQKKKKKKKKVVSYVTMTRTVQNGWNYTQSNLNSGISRDGGVVTFSVGNLPDRTFKDSDIDNTPVYDVVFTYTGNFHTNALRSASLIRKAGVPFAEIPNVFTAGDIVEADCNNANVYLYRDGSIEGHLEPQYGALGNDWEDFEVKVGQNIIRAVWSDWVDPNYKPVVKILFNEVYI